MGVKNCADGNGSCGRCERPECSKPQVVPTVCDTCITGQGYVWPMATDGDASHDWVERCDLCDRFANDDEAASFLAERLYKQGYRFEFGHAFIHSIDRHAPYIDNVWEV